MTLLTSFCQQDGPGMRRKPSLDHENKAFDTNSAAYLVEI